MTNYHKQPVEAPTVVQDFLSYLVGIKNKSRNTTYVTKNPQRNLRCKYFPQQDLCCKIFSSLIYCNKTHVAKLFLLYFLQQDH